MRTLNETTRLLRTALPVMVFANCFHQPLTACSADLPAVDVVSTTDFNVTKSGLAEEWDKATWIELNRRKERGHEYTARVKLLYSQSGLYVLFSGTDLKLTATLQADFEDLWHEDVFEVFLWTDERFPIYFEYEISPLGFELPIIVPNFEGKFLGWRPWHYAGERKIRKDVIVIGGKQVPHAKIKGWQAELFMPFELLRPLQNVPPKPGTQWRANFYRVDYDNSSNMSWDWSRVGPSFHEYKKFGSLTFK